VLSIFPGVGLLDSAFEDAGFCVVRGPDVLWGGDVRRFHPPVGVFWGVIGGPPCQDFSSARRAEPTGDGLAMLAEFARVVYAARPRWWLMENVDAVPDLRIDGYTWQRVDVDQGWYSGVRRLRHVQFGSIDEGGGRYIVVEAGRVVPGAEPAALACDGRTVGELKRLQGLPDEWDLPPFTVEAKKAAIGNGVPRVMGAVLAAAVLRAMGGSAPDVPGFAAVAARRCRCGCGRPVRGLALYGGPACRKRAERRRRDSAAASGVTRCGAAA
jgi:DNA (cytosine-5)-methyltransferase 1